MILLVLLLIPRNLIPQRTGVHTYELAELQNAH